MSEYREYSSPDLKNYRAPVERMQRLAVDSFCAGFLAGVVTLTVLILSYGIAR